MAWYHWRKGMDEEIVATLEEALEAAYDGRISARTPWQNKALELSGVMRKNSVR